MSIGEKRPNEAFAPLSDKQEFLEGCSTTVTTRRMGQNHLQIQMDVPATVGGEKMKCGRSRATEHGRH